MALVFNDRVKETSTTTGTGTLDLGGAFQDFQTFVAGIGNSNETYYNIVLPQTGEFEVGRGVVTDASTDTLSRLEVFTSSNNNNLVDFSAGTKTVFCTLPANKFVPGKFEGTNFTGSILIGHSTTGTLSSATNNTAVGLTALDALTSGNNNVAIGHNAFGQTTTAMQGVAVGVDAGGQNQGTDNVLVGFRAGQQASSTKNVGIGKEALRRVTGTRNIGLGFEAGDNITSGAGNVIIGGVDADSATADRQLKISGNDGSSTTTWISGDNTGALTFADKVVLAANKTIEFGDSGETISGDGTHLTIAGSDHINVNAQGELTLSSESNEIFFRDGTTLFLKVQRDGDFNVNLKSNNNKKIEFIGEDDGSTIDMLVLDGAEAGAATFNSTVTANAGLKADNITIDGTEIDLSSGDLKIDSAGDITLDADGGDIIFEDASTEIGRFTNDSTDFVIQSSVQDKDIIFKGNDGGSTITAMRLDMSLKGRVSIGSNSFPAERLSVFGEDNTAAATFKVKDTDSRGILIESPYSGFGVGFVGTDGTNSALGFKVNSTEVARFGTNGFFGIGTTSPQEELHVNGADPSIRIQDSDGGITTITQAGNDLSFDVPGQINLDADSNGLVTINDGGTQVGSFFKTASTFSIKSDIQDKRLEIKGNDGGSEVTAVAFHMANAGQANFNDKIILNANKVIEFGDAGETISGDGTDLTIVSSNDATIDVAGQINFDAGDIGRIHLMHDGTTYGHILRSGQNLEIKSSISDGDFEVHGNDGGVSINAFALDMSEAGAATFNSTITADGGKDVILGKNGGTNFSNSLLIGHNTTGTLSSAEKNTGVGDVALDALTSGDRNTAVGRAAGSNISSSSDQTVIGNSAGANLSTGNGGNVAVGSDSIFYNTTGVRNVAVGTSALQGASGQSPDYSVGIGYQSLLNITTGDYNLALGTQAGKNITSGKGNVIIGSVDAASATGDRQLKISGYDGSSTTNWISGDSSGNITVSGTVTANGEVLSAGVSAGFAVAMAIAL